MENNNIVKPVSCKDFFPSEVQKHSPSPHGAHELACFLPRFSDPLGAGVDRECGLFPERRGRDLYFIRSRCTFPLGSCLLCLQDGRKVVVSEGRGAALWCHVPAVPVVVL